MTTAVIAQMSGTLYAKLEVTRVFQDREALLRYSAELAAFNAPENDPSAAVEFGVYEGSSLRLMSTLLPASWTVIGFDSFTGLPEPWDIGDGKVYEKGHFSTQGKVPKNLTPNTILVVSEYDYSLDPNRFQIALPRVRFAHIDSDLRKSCELALDWLSPRITVGSVLLFDELCDFGGYYPNWKDGEWDALESWLGKNPGLEIEPVGRTEREQAAFAVVKT